MLPTALWPSNTNKYQEISGGKKRPARRDDNLAAIYEPNVWKCGSLNLLQTLTAYTACTGKNLPLPLPNKENMTIGLVCFAQFKKFTASVV
jgi:hypothetical protein